MIIYEEIKQGRLEAYRYEEGNNSKKTRTTEKRADAREVNSTTDKTLSDDVFSLAGNTTVAPTKLNMDGDKDIYSICSSTAININCALRMLKFDKIKEDDLQQTFKKWVICDFL